MKKNLSFLALTFLALSFCSFIYSSHSHLELPNKKITKEVESSFYYVLDSRYEGGSDAFIDDFNDHIRYPKEAIDNCRMGLSKIHFSIGKDGSISSFRFTNKLGFGIEKQLTYVLNKTQGKWKSSNNDVEFQMTVGFSVQSGEAAYSPDADLVLTGKNPFKWSTGNTYCESEAAHVKMMEKYIKKKKYDKALPHLEELLRRFPDDEYYQKQLKKIK